MFEIDEDSIVASGSGERNDLGFGNHFDTNALNLLLKALGPQVTLPYSA